MSPSTPVLTALNRAKSTLGRLVTGVGWLLGGLLAAFARSRVALGRLSTRTAAVARGSLWRTIRGPLATVLLGRRRAVSVTLVAFGAVLAAAAAVAVATTTGYAARRRTALRRDGHPVRNRPFGGRGRARRVPSRRGGGRGRRGGGRGGPDHCRRLPPWRRLSAGRSDRSSRRVVTGRRRT